MNLDAFALGEIPDANGVWSPGWIVQESGIVGSDGMIRTSSPLWPGVASGGTYIIAVPKFEYRIGLVIPDTSRQVLEIAKTMIKDVVEDGVDKEAAVKVAFANGLIFGTLLAMPFIIEKETITTSTLDVVAIPTVGRLPYITTVGVELNPRGIPTATVKLDIPTSDDSDPFAPPVVSQAEFNFNNDEPLVYLTGKNFLNASDDLGSKFEDLVVNFHSGDKTYTGTVIPELSRKLADKTYVVAVRPPKTVALGESSIELVRPQKERRGSNSSDGEVVEYKSKKRIELRPQDVDIALVTQVWSDTVTVVNTANPEDILATDGLTSRDLVLAKIPVGLPDVREEGARDAAVTSNATRAYVPLEYSGLVSVVDLMTLQQIDTNSETESIDPIDLRSTHPSAMPRSIAIEPKNNYAYVADSQVGTIYVLDIDPKSATYHQLVQTINVSKTGLGAVAVNSDGTKLFATTRRGTNSPTGQIFVININPQDRPKDWRTNSINPRKWHQLIGTVDALDAGTEGLAATNNPEQMVFTRTGLDAHGFGVLTITSSDPTSFAATTSYTGVGLGSAFDYFDVNDARAAVITKDGKYAFVTGFNGRQFGSGIPSVDGPLAGGNIGIIVDPLTDRAKLVAATRPIPMGLTKDLVLSGDDKYLTAVYPGVGSVFMFDVEEIVKTLEHPGGDLSSVPIDELNPNISIASDLVPFLVKGEGYDFVVPEGSNRAPIAIGNNPWSITSVSHSDWLDLTGPGTTTNDLTPTFEWQFDSGFEDVKEVSLFVSTLPQGEGLLPWDKILNLSDSLLLPELSYQERQELLTQPWYGYDDFNPGRILTATWKKETNTWYLHDGKTVIAQVANEPLNTSTRLTLSNLLTAGQTYHWAVQAISTNGQSIIDYGQFQTLAALTTNPFSSVTVLTHGFQYFTPDTGVPDSFYDLADSIVSVSGKDTSAQGLILRYDKPTNLWTPVDERGKTIATLTGGLNPSDANYMSTLAGNIQTNYINQNKSLVLLSQWSTENESIVSDSGFTEAAADAIFASLVQLDQALGGGVGEYDSQGHLARLYEDDGDLIRRQGAIFNSPLHFIGFSRGTVVNSEIVQRVGTFFPYAGGAINPDGTPVVDANGKPVRDLQMTTVDPHDFRQESLKSNVPFFSGDYRDFNEPAVQVWDNVTFADNYYQTVADPNGKTFTPNGRLIEGADVNVLLNGRTGFTWDNRQGGPHLRVFAWYAGTADLALTNTLTQYLPMQDTPEEEQKGSSILDWAGGVINGVKDFTGKVVSRTLDVGAALLENPWYVGDAIMGSSQDARPTAAEGIGTGWSYSKLGGGARPVVDMSKRKSVSFDNTDEDIVEGDYAIPTVFNGNFDVGISDDPNTPVAGWSFHNGGDPVLQKYLVDKDSITTLVETEIVDEPYLDDGVGDNTAPLRAALTVEERKNADRTLKMGGGNPTSPLGLNFFNVPEWGVLRFDLHVPTLGSGSLKVTVEPTDGSLAGTSTQINLAQAIGTAAEYANDTRRVGYGTTGFETFTLDIPDNLRGKTVTVYFELVGGSEVYLDNVSFKSQHLLLGNPTEARKPDNVGTAASRQQYDTNYLIEKPQYTVSYNDQTKTPNWVSWEINKSWLGSASREGFEFQQDSELPVSWYKTSDKDYAGQKFTENGGDLSWAQGHITPANDRKRTEKDLRSTFLGTNLIAQHPSNNSGLWKSLEGFTNRLAKQKDKQLYVTAGSFGTNTLTPTIPTADGQSITVPETLWKVIVILDDPNQSLSDLFKLTPGSNVNDRVIAIRVPNANTAGGSASPTWWDSSYQISVRDLEAELFQATGQPYNFLSSLPQDVQNRYEMSVYSGSVSVSAFLKAETSNNELLDLGNTLISNGTIGHDSVVKNSISQDEWFSLVGSIAENSISQVSLTEVGKLYFPSINQIGSSQVGSNELSLIQKRPTQVSSSQVGMIKERLFQTSPTQVSSTQVSSTQIMLGQVRVNEDDTFQIGSSQFIIPPKFAVTEVTFPSSVTLQQFFVTNVNTLHNPSLQNTTIPAWTNFLQALTPFNLSLEVSDLPTGQLAEAQITNYDQYGRPNGGTILIDTDANGKGWFIDPTPFDNSEFTNNLSDTAYSAAADSAAFGRYDLLTALLHEMGHLAGFISGYSEFDHHIQTRDGSSLFITPDGISAAIVGDHLDPKLYPYDLFSPVLTTGMRKLPSLLDAQLLDAINSNYSGNRNQEATAALNAPLTSTPLAAQILNGTFDSPNPTNPNYGWMTRGDSAITGGQAILKEGDRFNSNFSQSFTIPEGAKYLQFTLTGTKLGAGTKYDPSDSFEVALLDANTLAPLAGTATGLSQTDALLNIQHDGRAYLSPFVNLKGSAIANDTLTLDSPMTFMVDVSNIAPGTEAKLYFDLLGFGDRNAQVTLDNVRLISGNAIAPIATNDAATTNQATPIVLNVLANDSDSDGTIDPTTVLINTNPVNGTVAINSNGEITYTPNANFIGTDYFTYTVKDDQGEISDFATVTIQVNNVLPTISNVEIQADITEGTTAVFKAIASDSTDELTYTWNFGDGSNSAIGQTTNHTFNDNGNYTATLTVTDAFGASTTQVFSVIVANAVPIVTAGSDRTINEGEAIAFNGSFTDLGILDTHTIAWDFGDGTLVTDTLNPTHTYTNNGIYTVTLLVTDNNGDRTVDSLTVNVNNVAPTITDVAKDTNVSEGVAAAFRAVATDPGNDTLTYTWNFGDGSDIVTGNAVNHTFANNGLYTTTLVVRDEDGDYTSQTLLVEVANAAPVVTAGSDRTINEGEAITFNGNFTDTGLLDTHTIAWDFGDGTLVTDILNPTHTYTNNGIYTVKLTVTDNNGDRAVDTITVNVNNVTPTITDVASDTNISEGVAAAFRAVATDPGNDTLTYTWNFGDGSDIVTGDAVNHTFANNGLYTTTLIVTDSDGSYTSQTLLVDVANAAPVVTAIGDRASATEGDAINFTGSFTDTGTLDTHTILWDFGDGATASGILNPTHTYADNGIYTATLSITDSDEATSTSSVKIDINNAAPVVDTGLEQEVYAGESLTFNGSFTDAGKLDTHTIVWDFGDGTTANTLEATHTYTKEGNYTVKLSVTDNAGATSTDTAVVVVKPLPTMTISDRTIVEGNDGTTNAIFTLNLSSPSTKPITVNYATSDGSATAGNDYTATSGTLTFAPGSTTTTISVQVNGDRLDEIDETFLLNLTNPTNATIAKAQAVVTIVDNDAPPALTIDDQTIIEGSNGITYAVMTVNLSAPSGQTVKVNYVTANGTATAGSDYVATSGTLTFAPGQTSQTIKVAINGDRIDESDETFFVNLSNAINATIADNNAIATIVDDDASPLLKVSANPPQLWPPNHKMVEVQVNVAVSDDFDANPTVKLVSITSNEPDNGLGDGNTAKDIDIRPDGRIFLRAERSGGGTGRVYTLTYSATDSAGNVTYSTTQVRVPHSQGK